MTMWQALEEWVEVPSVLLAACVVLVPLWLTALRKFTRAIVWGLILLDVALLAYLMVRSEFEWPFIAITAIVVLGIIFFRKKIKLAIEILHLTMVGLSQTPSVFAACFIVFAV